MEKQIIKQLKDKSSLQFSKAVMALLLFAMLVASCDNKEDKPDDKDPDPEPYLQVQPSTVDFTNAGGKQTVTVTTNIEGWTFDVDADGEWVTAVRTTAGNGIELTAEPNPDNAERKTFLRITAGAVASENKVVELKQQPGAAITYYLTIEPTGTVTLDADGEVLNVAVNTNVADWTFDLDANSWLSAVKTATGLQLTAVENPYAATRSVTLRIIAEQHGLERTLTVTQRAAGPFLDVSPDDTELSISNAAQVVEITVDTNIADWTFYLDANDWLTPEKTATGVKLTALENPNLATRSVTLRISAEEHDLEHSIIVTQEGNDTSIKLPDMEGEDF